MRYVLPLINFKFKISNLKFFSNKGFTLIEIIVVFSITAIVGGIGLASFNEYGRRQLVEQAAREIEQMLEDAKASAVSGVKPHYVNGLGVPDPETCFFDFDQDEWPDPGEGTTTAIWELRGYRVIISVLSNTYSLYVVCNDGATDNNILIEQKNLPQNVTFNPAPSCNGNFYYRARTNVFICGSGSPLPWLVRVRTGAGATAITKTVSIDQNGRTSIL